MIDGYLFFGTGVGSTLWIEPETGTKTVSEFWPRMCEVLAKLTAVCSLEETSLTNLFTISLLERN